METVFVVILLIIFCMVIKLITDRNDNYELVEKQKDDPSIVSNDTNYYTKFAKENMISTLINNNRLAKPIEKKNKILFITYDNRYQEEYVIIHNYNINKYVEKYGYEYKYYNRCNQNVYWCKIFMVLEALKKNIYDYVVWLDSDTIIKNFDIDIGNVLNMFSSDIFIGSDNNSKYNIINSGVFGIKNSETGIRFLDDCISSFNDKCLKEDGTLGGKWAASCYEQGVMNLMISNKYSKNTTILTNSIIFNYNVCSDDVFIMHLYASNSNYRVKCFHSNNPAL
jgi:hypothetical protein